MRQPPREAAAAFSPDKLISVYRGWYEFALKDQGWERAKWILIDDLSGSAVKPANFGSLADVRGGLEDLIESDPDAKTTERIKQSIFYLDQKPGDAVTKEAVLKRGLPWRPVTESEIARLHAEYQAIRGELISEGRLSEAGADARYKPQAGGAGVAAQIQALGLTAVKGFLTRFPELRPANFEVREVLSPLPWSNMVTYEDGIKYVANRGELADNGEGRQGLLALHEIGGHVLHFSQLLADQSQRNAAPHLLALSIHTYDTYFIEGIAQFLTSIYTELIAPEDKLLRMDVKHYELEVALRHKNLTDLIEGKTDIDKAARLDEDYLGVDAAQRRRFYEVSLKDAFFCCLRLVYYPAHQTLLPALRLDEAKLRGFLKKLLHSHYSPAELDRLVAESLA